MSLVSIYLLEFFKYSTNHTALTAYDPNCWDLAADTINSTTEIKGVVVYADITHKDSIKASTTPALHHLAGKGADRPLRSSGLTAFYYPSVSTFKFAIPFQDSFHYTTEAISHTRSITHLKKLMDGPYFDLELIWDEHTYYEFADRSVEHTMSTMVQEPYVNHVPTVSCDRQKLALPKTNVYL